MTKDEFEKSAVWISWEKHTRSRSISSAMKIPLLEISISGRSAFRYIKSIFITYGKIREKHVKYIFFQNPSIVLSMFLVLCNFFNKKKLIMDAHNAGIYPLEGKSRIVNFLAARIVASSDITIVTNRVLANIVEGSSGRPFVLTDPIPSFGENYGKTVKKNSNNEIVVISTWADDEPFLEIIEAAKYLENRPLVIKITGRPPKSVREQILPANISLEGFVSDAEYKNLLINADLTIDLTKRTDCLVCGAYESVAAGTPCIVSSTVINRETFTGGFVFTELDAHSISLAITSALIRKEELTEELEHFRQKYIKNSSQKIDELFSLIY